MPLGLGEICPGTEVFAITNTFISALIAVEYLLDENGHHNLWYCQEVIMEDGVYKVILEESVIDWKARRPVEISQKLIKLYCMYNYNADPFFANTKL